MPDHEAFRRDFERWALAFEHAGWGIVISDGRLVETCNPEFARQRGYSVDELRGKPVLELFAPSVREAVATVLVQVATGSGGRFESEHLRRDGSTFPVEVNITVVRDEAGQPKYRVVHVQDLTEQKRHAAELQAASLSREVLDRLIEGCQVIDFEYRYLYLNDLAVEHARRPRHELLGRTMQACYPGIEHSPMFSVLKRSLTQRTSEATETEFVYEDGVRRHYSLRFVPVPQGLCVLSLDVTAQRTQLAAIVNDSHDAIVGCTLDGIITSWNKGAERLLGYAVDEAVGHHVSKLLANSPESVPAIARRIASGERIVNQPATRLHKDGHVVEVSITQSPVKDHHGNTIGVSTIARDMTELNQVHRELVEAKDKAEAANRELESFSYSVAHDLRAPLRSIDGFSQALLEDCEPQLDAHGKKYLGYVRDSAQLMARLIDDLLQLSRLSRRPLAAKPTNLTALVLTCVEALRRLSPRRVVDVVVAPDVVAQGDPTLLGVVIENLVGNAWKFTGKRAQARIEFGTAVVDGQPAYFVRDDGAGFDAAYAQKLFAPFQRLHRTVDFEGTGIGLATVQRIVLRHHGRVWAEGAVDAGATFWFTLNETGARHDEPATR